MPFGKKKKAKTEEKKEDTTTQVIDAQDEEVPEDPKYVLIPQVSGGEELILSRLDTMYLQMQATNERLKEIVELLKKAI